MREDLRQPVVVGFDGSASAAAAVDVAAAEARALGVPLRIVHAYVWPLFYAPLANVPYRADDWAPPPAALDIVHRAARRVSDRYPGLPVETAVSAGSGGPVLVDESAHASLIVVGAQGTGGLAGLLSGSVAAHVSARAQCPIVVVRAGQTPRAEGGPVAVGVDGTPGSMAALRFAREWASLRGASIVATHVTDAPDTSAAAVRLAGWVATDHPTAGVETSVMHGISAVDALVKAGRSARLLVVGSRHREELATVALGSVGRALVRRATCPVVIVPDAPAHAPAPASAASQ